MHLDLCLDCLFYFIDLFILIYFHVNAMLIFITVALLYISHCHQIFKQFSWLFWIFILSCKIQDNPIEIKDFCGILIINTLIYILLLGDLTFLLLTPHPTILYLCISPNFALWFLVIFVLFFTYMLSCYCSIVFVTSENGIFSICICKCYYYCRKKAIDLEIFILYPGDRLFQ